jgi:hypothetical protein
MSLEAFEVAGRWNAIGFPRSKNQFAALALGAMLIFVHPGTARAFRDYIFIPGTDSPNVPYTPVSYPRFYPTINETLPPPLTLEMQPNLSLPPLPALVADPLADSTVSAWVHVPAGKVVKVFTYTESAGIWGNISNEFGIGDTRVLGDNAASILNLPLDSPPKYFAFFAGMDTYGGYTFRSIGLSDATTRNVDGVDWLHVTAGWAFADMGIYEGGILHQLDEQNHYFGLQNPPFADVGAFHSLYAGPPPFGVDKYGGCIGQIAVYPNLITPNLVSQLDATNPFGVPEASTFASLAIGLLALKGFSRERPRSS